MAVSEQRFMEASYIIKLIARGYIPLHLLLQSSDSNQLHGMALRSTDLVMMDLILLVALINYRFSSSPYIASYHRY